MLLLIGCIGLFFASVGIPLFVAFCSLFSKSIDSFKETVSQNQVLGGNNLVALIPVHNDHQLLSATLKSLSELRSSSNNRDKLNLSKILVVLDGCTDQSSEVARSYAAELIEQPSNLGKWRSISNAVFKLNDLDYIALVDCGVIWPPELLSEAFKSFSDQDVIAVAPSYSSTSSGFFSQLFWWFERSLKALESFGRGPVSVHGATVIYRAEQLKAAFLELSARNWLNDDVILPLTVRSMNPKHRIVYLERVLISDTSPKKSGNLSTRRERMMRGNIEWLSLLTTKIWKRDPETAFVAIRRVARLFWAYWLLFIGVGALQAFSLIDSTSAVALSLLGLVLMRSVSGAAKASFNAPLYLIPSFQSKSEVAWR